MNLAGLFDDFLKSERAGGILLIFCTIISLLLANSSLQTEYIGLWNTPIAGQPVVHWINDGLMSIFFLLIGLELEREIYVGELSSLKNALVPIFAAVGGMILPALLFLLFNLGMPSQSGAGIPMATDIAFAIAILSVLGSRVPASLKILLTAIAVIDDLGAIIVIAVFYTNTLSWISLGIAIAIFLFLLVLNRLKINSLVPYLVGGGVMWYFMLKSGVHPTFAGVLLAFAVPFRSRSGSSASVSLQHFLHKPVAFLILPLFALANTCILINDQWFLDLGRSSSLGILAGLVVGKPLGIFLFSFAAVTSGICRLPRDIKWKHIIGLGFLGGIGFTMSIFITLLAFDQAEFINQSKIAILLASLISAFFGFIGLRMALPGTKTVG